MAQLRVIAVERHRDPQVGRALGEPRRHDSDQRSRNSIENEAAIQNRRIEIEALEPHLVAHHEDRRRARLYVLLGRGPPEQRRNTQKPERVRSDQRPVELFRPLAARIEDIDVSRADRIAEDMALLLVIEIFRKLEETPSAGPAFIHVVNGERDDAARVHVGKRIEQHVLDHAEDRSRRADSERQRQRRERRESRLIAQPPQPVAKVLQDRPHTSL